MVFNIHVVCVVVVGFCCGGYTWCNSRFGDLVRSCVYHWHEFKKFEGEYSTIRSGRNFQAKRKGSIVRFGHNGKAKNNNAMIINTPLQSGKWTLKSKSTSLFNATANRLIGGTGEGSIHPTSCKLQTGGQDATLTGGLDNAALGSLTVVNGGEDNHSGARDLKHYCNGPKCLSTQQ